VPFNEVCAVGEDTEIMKKYFHRIYSENGIEPLTEDIVIGRYPSNKKTKTPKTFTGLYEHIREASARA